MPARIIQTVPQTIGGGTGTDKNNLLAATAYPAAKYQIRSIKISF
jgi:hypothetical protein